MRVRRPPAAAGATGEPRSDTMSIIALEAIMTEKINKAEPFNLERVIEDRVSRSLESFVANPDIGTDHEPHVDLTVRRSGEDTVKYRIYDTTGASNLLSDHGSGGLGW